MKELIRNVLILLILPILPFFSPKSVSKEVPNSTENATVTGNQTSAKEGRAPRVRTQVGIASWYGADWHGRKTASGEHFNMHGHTAAHKSLPLGTIAKVTNLENGKRVMVKINDREPYKKGRIIDLSHAAAKSIGMLKDGTAKVKVEVIAMPRKSNLEASNRS